MYLLDIPLIDPVTMRSLTRQFWELSVGGPIGGNGSDVDNQGSDHTLKSWPGPRAQPRPFDSRSLPTNIPLQPWDAQDGGWAFKKDLWTQYFPNKVRASRDEGFLRILQESLARRVSLNCAITLNPSPPTFLGLVRVCQEFQQIFFVSGDESHQKRVRSDWIFLHIEMGSLKHDITYVGIAVSTDFNKIIFPAPERNLEVQLWARCRLIRSTKEAKMSLFPAKILW